MTSDPAKSGMIDILTVCFPRYDYFVITRDERLPGPVRPDHLDKLGSKRPGLNQVGLPGEASREAWVEGYFLLHQIL